MSKSLDALRKLSEASEQDEARRIMSVDFGAYVRRAWEEIDGSELKWNLPLEIITYECQRWLRGEIRHLAIAVPPGSAKSLTASVFLPTHDWASNPKTQYLCCTHGEPLAVRDNLKSRDLIKSKWYQDTFVRGKWKFKRDQDAKTRYMLADPKTDKALGLRQAIGGKSGLTGWRGDKIILDDPVDLNPKKPPTIDTYEQAWTWVKYILTQRVNDAKTAQALLIMQMSHDLDPIARLLKEQSNKSDPEAWSFVMLDQEMDPALPIRHPLDLRAPGELLVPDRWGLKEVEGFKYALGVDYDAQHQQNPQTGKNSIVKKGQIVFRYSDPDLSEFDHIIISADCANKDKETSSFVSIQAWGLKDITNVYLRKAVLLDQYREHIDYTGTREMLRLTACAWPMATFIVVEDKANGIAIVNDLKSELPHLFSFNVDKYGSKEQRLKAVSPIFTQQRVEVVANGESMINKRPRDYADLYETEVTRFPKFPTDDMVDTTSQVLLFGMYELEAALEARGAGAFVIGGWPDGKAA